MARLRRRLWKSTVVLVIAASAGACVAKRPPLYRWGSYEPLLYSMWIEPGTADPQQASESLTADVLLSEGSGARVPPGVHAHLGWLYWLQGREAEARAELAAESALYPESGKLVGRMLERVRTPTDDEIDGGSQ